MGAGEFLNQSLRPGLYKGTFPPCNAFLSSSHLIISDLPATLRMSLPTRALGRNGPQVPAIGLGLMSLGSVYGPAGSLEDKVAFLEHAHTIGARFWDTADIYFDSEDAVGEWIKKSGNRDDIFLATKFALGYDLVAGTQSIHSDRDYVKAACEKSLKRLGIDTIDLYYCHRVDGVTPIEQTIEAMVELKK